LIRLVRLHRPGARVLPAGPAAAFAQLAVPVEDGIPRAARRQGRAAMPSREDVQQLLRAPLVPRAQRQAGMLNVDGRAMGTRRGGP